jgi:hypothetical protein
MQPQCSPHVYTNFYIHSFFLGLRSYVCRILAFTKSIGMYVGYTDFYSVRSRLVPSPYVCMYVIQISTGYNFCGYF